MMALGSDTWCVDSIKSGRLASEKMALAQVCFHRLTTKRGTLRGGEEEQNFGKDLSELIGSTHDEKLSSILPGQIQAELCKDERVRSVSTVIESVSSGIEETYRISISVKSSVGPFILTLGASSVSVQLLGVS